MRAQLDNDIWFIVIHLLRNSLEKRNESESKLAKSSLLALRQTSRFFAVIIAPIVLSYIQVTNLGTETYERLATLLKSPSTCEAVKTYVLRPKIATSRQGDQISAYHKIPPHLDYGRQSSSKQIQLENKKLREAATLWDEQYRIIYPTQNKAAAALKTAFKWSGTTAKANLKDSVYFTALDAFSNLNYLHIRYPRPNSSKLIADVQNEFSIAIGRYLAKKPAYLTGLYIQDMRTQDVTTMVEAMVPKTTQTSTPLGLTYFSVTIEPGIDSNDDVLHSDANLAEALSKMFNRMPKLRKLSLYYNSDKAAKKLNYPFWGAIPMLQTPLVLSLLPSQTRVLQNLKELKLGGLALTAEHLLSITAAAPTRLNILVLDGISLTDSSWAYVFQEFIESEALQYLSPPSHATGIMYHDGAALKSWRVESPEDIKTRRAWEAKIENHVYPLDS